MSGEWGSVLDPLMKFPVVTPIKEICSKFGKGGVNFLTLTNLNAPVD